MQNPWAFGWTQLLTIAGFVITISIAVGGFRTFGRWKRERIEERRIEVALDALAIAYEAKFRFESIRSRRILENELEDIDKQMTSVSYPLPPHKSGQEGPYAVLKRISRSGEYFDRVSKIEPKFMAIFGADKEIIFSLLYEAKEYLESVAEYLFQECSIEHDPGDTEARELLRNLRSQVFGIAAGMTGEDIVDEKISEFQKRIEALCRPIVDQTFGRR